MGDGEVIKEPYKRFTDEKLVGRVDIGPQTRDAIRRLNAEGPLARQTVSTDDAARKAIPIATGFFDYFPDAIVAVAELSLLANEKHNGVGSVLHWSKEKSSQHADSLLRHFVDRGKWDTAGYAKPVRHSAEVAWRAMANLQIEIENDRKAGR